MKVGKISTSVTRLSLLTPSKGLRPVSAAGPQTTDRKLWGEPLPRVVDGSRYPDLEYLFAPMGMLDKIRKKLEGYSKKKGTIVLADGVVACAGEDDVVYVGVDFLIAYQNDEETIAGVMAHEWGHLIQALPPGFEPDKLTWDELHDLRRDHEGGSDAFAGRFLAFMRYSYNGMIAFLTRYKPKVPTMKYHSQEIRAEIVKRAYEEEKKRLERFHDSSIINPSVKKHFINIG